MRDDFHGDLPGFRVTDEDRLGAAAVAPEPPVVRALREPLVQRQRNGALWAVCVGLLVALVGLGYWSHQQQSRLQQQLVATQESFARISEEAAGRLQDISGKVIATESSLSEGEQERIRQIGQLEQKVQQLAAALDEQDQLRQQQQQALQAVRQSLQQAGEEVRAQEQRLAALEQLPTRMATLEERQQQQQQGIAELVTRDEQAAQQRAQLAGELALAIEQLQQLDQLAAMQQQLAEQQTLLARQGGQLQALLEASSGTSVEQRRLDGVDEALRSIDSFRVQTNRSLSTLQSQISNLQQQIGKP